MSDARGGGRTVEVRLVDLPVALHHRTSEHTDGLIREFRWLDADPTGTPVRVLRLGSRIRRRANAVMEPLDRVIARAQREGREAIDLAFPVPVEAAELCRQVTELFEEADEFCRAGDMLTLAAPADTVAYRRWFLGEFIRQVEGEPPRPWPESPEAAGLPDAEAGATGVPPTR